MKISIISFICLMITGCNFMKVDRCLDKGGRWDKEKQECIYLDELKKNALRDGFEIPEKFK
ncbi:hypothetical protein KTJ29_08890 [Acinetobacter bereziniae]|nr:hypothetical protein [Acinetobacter bereziniae]MBJ8454831.1 hypothetical protein [Acinetobacter bereziniae]MBJ9902539.1 hypothetical protein [Acinetobacter bereziniae]MCU4318729.1 hypothetical protein [Acinetobacter bereziniae]MCU4598963.1 hypothetical protein [Acinetobacter bereziniae]